MAGFEYEGAEVRALRSISKAGNASGAREFQANLIDLNRSTAYMADYMIVMQKGIDDANKDIIQKIQDFIDDLIIVFSGGSGTDFDLGDLERVIQNIMSVLGIPDLSDVLDIGVWAQQFFDNITKNPIIASITDAINNFIRDLLLGLDAFTGGVFNLDELARHFNKQAETTAGNSAALTALQNKLVNGSTFADNFDRANTVGVLNNGWVQGGQGQALQIINNAARIDNTGTSTGIRYAICPTLASTDDTTVSAVVNPAGVARAAMTSLFIRANADLTQFVYANIYGKSCYLGRGTRSGNTWNFTDWKSNTNAGVSEGALVELNAVGNKYTLVVNGATLLEHDDTSSYPVDESHRTAAFSSETRAVGPNREYSWGLAVFSLRPNAMAAIQNAQQLADEAAAQSAANASAILALQQQVGTGGGSSGYSMSDNFDRPAAGNLGPDWTIPSGQIHLDGGGRAKVASSFPEGTYYARWNTQMTSDDMQVTAIIGDNDTTDNPDQGVFLLLRGSADFNSGAYCYIAKGYVDVGKISFAGGTHPVRTLWRGTGGLNIRNGAVVEFKVSDNHTYVVKINGATMITYQDLGNTVPTGTGYRHFGFAFGRITAFSYVLRSSGLTDYYAKDLSSAQKTGCGWGLYRGNTGGVAVGGSNDLVPDFTFDGFTESLGVDILNLGKGVILIKKSGFYVIHVKLALTTVAGTSDEHRAILYYSEPGAATLLIRKVGKENTGTRAWAASETFVAYCAAGSWVAPGLYQSGSNTIVGEPNKTVTYFDGALMGGI